MSFVLRRIFENGFRTVTGRTVTGRVELDSPTLGCPPITGVHRGSDGLLDSIFTSLVFYDRFQFSPINLIVGLLYPTHFSTRPLFSLYSLTDLTRPLRSSQSLQEPRPWTHSRSSFWHWCDQTLEPILLKTSWVGGLDFIPDLSLSLSSQSIQSFYKCKDYRFHKRHPNYR